MGQNGAGMNIAVLRLYPVCMVLFKYHSQIVQDRIALSLLELEEQEANVFSDHSHFLGLLWRHLSIPKNLSFHKKCRLSSQR